MKTFQPILPVQVKGPVCQHPEEALYDIFLNVHDEMHEKSTMTDENIEQFVRDFIEITQIHTWSEGSYSLFNTYFIVIKEIDEADFNQMSEFHGY